MQVMRILSLIAILVLVSSCKKKSDDCNSCNVQGPGNPPPGLTFVLNGTNTTITADSAWFLPSTNNIIAYYQGNSHKLVIKTSAQTVGTYAISATNILTYSENASAYSATSGSITITAKSATTMSGDFLTMGNSGGFTSVKGSFTDIPKR